MKFHIYHVESLNIFILLKLGIVDSQGIVEFYNWNIETGPQVNYQVSLWERIEDNLQRNDVPSAAARLRRGLEEYFGMVCENLKVRTIHKPDKQWELGELLIPAMDQYRELLKKAKNAAISWKDDERKNNLDEIDSIRSEIYKRTYSEQWAVNVNVHYNNWANFTVQDFRPVTEAFQDLCGLFFCSKCGGLIYLDSKEQKPVSVRCNCGDVNLNLTVRNKTS